MSSYSQIFSPYFSLWAFILGLCLGSFYLVCIQRYLAEQSILGRSNCGFCGKKLSFFELIPIFSYIWQKGQCKNCKTSIGLVYPLTELASGLLAWLLANHYGFSLEFFVLLTIFGLLFIASGIDLYAMIIPDFISLGLILPSMLTGVYLLNLSFLDSILGSLIGAGFFYLIILAYRILYKMEAMGLGDVKLMLSLGALCGFSKLSYLVLAASLSGIAFYFYFAKNMKNSLNKSLIPFGPFLSFGAFLCILYTEDFIRFFIVFTDLLYIDL